MTVAKDNKPAIRFSIVLTDFLGFIFIGLSVLFLNLWQFHTHEPFFSDTQLIGMSASLFAVVLTACGFYIFVEYKYNHLNFKNIFMVIALIVIINNIIAVSTLQSHMLLPEGQSMDITLIERIYHYLSGFMFALIILFNMYLIPRRIVNRRFVNYMLMGIIGIAGFFIVASFITDAKNYLAIFEDGLSAITTHPVLSIIRVKNVFSLLLLISIYAAIILRLRTHNYRWIFLVIPLYFFLFLSYGKISIGVATLTIGLYLIIRLIIQCKKDKDILFVSLLGLGVVAVLGSIFVVFTVYSNSGLLFKIKDFLIRMAQNSETTFGSRSLIWRSCIELISNFRCIFGLGITGFKYPLQLVYGVLAPQWDKHGIDSPHSMVFDILDRGGVVLLLIFIFIYAYTIRAAIKLYKRDRWLSVGTILMIFTSLFVGVFESSYFCGVEIDFLLGFVLITPILSDYYLYVDKKECDIKKKIVEDAKSIKDVTFNSWIMNLNKKRLIYESKYLEQDLKARPYR